MKVRTSILIATRNRPDLLRECLESLVRCGLEDAEVLVLDQSRDGQSEALVRELGGDRLRYTRLPLPGKSRALNAGIAMARGSRIALTDDDWTWVLTVNVLGTVRTVAAFLPLLRGRDGWRQISITASSGVFVPAIRLGAYTTSKSALVGYGDTLRLELADEGIGVTVVFPAGMMTRHLESSAAARPEVRPAPAEGWGSGECQERVGR